MACFDDHVSNTAHGMMPRMGFVKTYFFYNKPNKICIKYNELQHFFCDLRKVALRVWEMGNCAKNVVTLKERTQYLFDLSISLSVDKHLRLIIYNT